MISPLPAVPSAGFTYLLDTNVWLKVFDFPADLFGDDSKFPKEKKQRYAEHRGYYSFVRGFTLTFAPQIILPSIALSEIVNVYMRSKMFLIYQKKHGFHKQYKEHYRPSWEHRRDFKRIQNGMLSYERCCIQTNDGFGTAHTISSALKYNSNKLDFADHYMYAIAKKRNCVLVTHDADYSVCNDIPILTLNQNMLPKPGSASA